jgi:Flp pilus assembly protein TadG
MKSPTDRGSAAVEFALVAPLLIALVAGIAEFGRAYYLQTTLAGSAREAVRVVALKNDPAAARTAARGAAAPLMLTDAQIFVNTACSIPGNNAKVTISYSTPFISGMFGTTLDLSGQAVMRCGG